MLLSGIQEGIGQEIKLEQVSTAAFRVLLRFLYAAELPIRLLLKEEDAIAWKELVKEMLQGADLFHADALAKHCLELFKQCLTVHMAIEQLVWTHSDCPAEVRCVSNGYFVSNYSVIEVRFVTHRHKYLSLTCATFDADSCLPCRCQYQKRYDAEDLHSMLSWL